MPSQLWQLYQTNKQQQKTMIYISQTLKKDYDLFSTKSNSKPNNGTPWLATYIIFHSAEKMKEACITCHEL